ncbi:unnamed protein product [Schistocephalus solidus]|uniref:Uncharacterized protein n=1 Tax=Schistocephalus solidus TaxID=70667 RepID=A0A183SHP8_SCHSO|nr:unnamed protein product [Schistocephalus solidus]
MCLGTYCYGPAYVKAVWVGNAPGVASDWSKLGYSQRSHYGHGHNRWANLGEGIRCCVCLQTRYLCSLPHAPNTPLLPATPQPSALPIPSTPPTCLFLSHIIPALSPPLLSSSLPLTLPSFTTVENVIRRA